jgi:insulysin
MLKIFSHWLNRIPNNRMLWSLLLLAGFMALITSARVVFAQPLASNDDADSRINSGNTSSVSAAPSVQIISLDAFASSVSSVDPITSLSFPDAASSDAEENAIADFSPIATFDVIKSDQDVREYRYLTLPNKLRVLLISDPSAEKAAAALNVNVGHNQNPQERPGLAHFLEHMLFLGTEKYPLAGEYQAFISQHGGRLNAYTAAENTNYFFEIDSAQLESALDRFAQFFIAPLLDATYIERERNAVHAEYRARIKDDTRRALDVYRELMNPDHPSAGFSVGTLDTLADGVDQSLREELINFYNAHYSANLMTLTVLGRESLSELQNWVAPRFGLVANRDVAVAKSYPALFPDKFLPASVTIQPEKELRQLTFLFPIPNDDAHYRKKPFGYIAHMLGHEGEGSVLSLLKQLGWAENLSAGVGLKSRHDGFFYITVDLTEKGVRAKDQIPIVVLHMIQQLELRGIKDWRYLELQQMADINFRFQEKLPPMDTVRNLAQSMHAYDPRDVLQGEFLYAKYDENLIRESLSYLRLKNLLLVLTAPDIKTNQTSFYYQTPYNVASLTDPQLEVKPVVRRRMFFPEPNIFIPNRVTVKAQPILPARSAINAPQMVLENSRARAWFQQDQHFNVPKIHLRLRLKLPLVARDVSGAAQAHLFAALVRDELNEFAYPARIAGLEHSIKAHPRGLDIELAGYSVRQGLLLNKIAETIREGRFSEERFIALKAELVRAWRNQEKNIPYLVMLPQVPALQVDPFWNDQALSLALEQKSYKEFLVFASAILRNGEMDALFYGNIFRQDALRLAALTEHQLLGVKAGNTLPDARVLQLTATDKPWLYRHPLTHDDRIVLLYVQGLADTPEDAAHMQLLRQILQPAFFDKLRTEKQLGYVVSVFPMPLRTLEGSVFLVQSPSADETLLAAEINKFLLSQRALLAVNLAENQQALLHRLQEPSRSLAEQADRLWESILLGDYTFDRRDKLAEAVAGVTKESMTRYFDQSMLDANRRLWLSSPGFEPEGYHTVQEIELYRAQQKSLSYP